jgi:hypothetical protein
VHNYINGIMEDIAREIGFEAAIRLVGLHGGRTLYVPQVAKPDHHLALLLGEKPFVAFVQMYGGETLTVPRVETIDRMRRLRRVTKMVREQCYSRRKIALIERLSEKHIDNLLRQAEELKVMPMVLTAKPPEDDSVQMVLVLEEEGESQ